MSVKLAPPEWRHGGQIWAFLNIRTNQVLYSLTRFLAPSAVKQLPDAGANNNPATVRRDHWRPFFHVTLPEGENSVAQGQDLFRKLREWRMLHETNWEAPASLSRPRNEEEVKELKERLDRKGGSKKMTVYDLIKREKKKIRARMVMDQKANSIADLAAVLRHQQEYSLRRSDKSREGIAEQRRQVLRLAQSKPNGELKRLGHRISDVRKSTESTTQEKVAHVRALRFKVRKILWANDAVRTGLDHISTKLGELEASGGEATASSALRAAKDHLEQILRAPASIPDGEGSETVATAPTLSDEVEEEIFKYVPLFPLDLAPASLKPKDRRTSDRIRRAPIYTTDGVVVQWSNILDAEYAEAWPANVEHVQMKATRDSVFNMPFLEYEEQPDETVGFSHGAESNASIKSDGDPEAPVESLSAMVQRFRKEFASTKVLKREIRDRGWLVNAKKRETKAESLETAT